MAHIIEVLRGSRSQRVLERGHDRLPTYGVGKERSKDEWRELAGQLIEQGLVGQDLQFGGLYLTKKSGAVLEGGTVFARRSLDPVRAVPQAEALTGKHDAALFERLSSTTPARGFTIPWKVSAVESVQSNGISKRNESFMFIRYS